MKENINITKNNKGMTLIECIVSIVILSICIIPLLNTFSFCYKYTAKAKMRQKATNVAQDVIETYKADNLDTLMKKITDTETVLRSTRSDYAENYIPKIVTSSDGTGYYLYSNLTAEGSNERYDAVVKVSSGNATYDPSTNPTAYDYTSTGLFNGPEDTCVITQDVTLYSDILTTVSNAIQNQRTVYMSAGWNNPCVTHIYVKRENVFTFEAADASAIADYEVLYESSYRFVIELSDMNASSVLTSTTGSMVVNVTTSDSTYATRLSSETFVDDLNSITFFYYPIYDGADYINVQSGYVGGAFNQYVPVTLSEDLITVYNSVKEIDLNIYKQKYASVKTAEEIVRYTTFDDTYVLKVQPGSETSTYKKTGITGNVGSNIYNSTESGSQMLAHTITGYLAVGSVLDSAAFSNNQLVCVVDVYIFAHGEAGDLTSMSTYAAVDAINFSEARANVEATIVDNIKY